MKYISRIEPEGNTQNMNNQTDKKYKHSLQPGLNGGARSKRTVTCTIKMIKNTHKHSLQPRLCGGSLLAMGMRPQVWYTRV